MNQKRTEKLGVVNGLRGFAILAVIYHHLFYSFTGPGFKSFDIAGIAFHPFTYLSNGWFGVNLFFILSGFVLSYPYFLGERNFVSAGSIKRFYVHRARRLLPLYYFSVVFCIVFVVHPASLASFPREIFLLVTVLFNFTNDMWAPRYNWVLWSLGIEIWFSILFPLMMISIHKYGITKILLFVLVISLVTRIMGNSEMYDIGNPYANPVKDSIVGRLDEFVWGIYLCYVFTNKDKLIVNIHTGVCLVIGFVMVSMSCMLWDYVTLNFITRSIVPFINIILDTGLVLIILSLLLIRRGFIKWIFSNYFIQLLGVMCYSLYIWHGVALLNIITKFDLIHIVEYLILLFLLSSLSYRYIEFGGESDSKKLFLLDHKNI